MKKLLKTTLNELFIYRLLRVFCAINLKLLVIIRYKKNH